MNAVSKSSIVSQRLGTTPPSAPTLSVILCAHRSNPWLAAAIDSILQQSDPDFEFLIAANACTDALWQELQALTCHDSRVRLFRSSIGQLAFNLNLLADQARGDYLVRMDADDVSEPQRLEHLRAALAATPLDILGSAVALIDEKDQMVGRMDFPKTTAEIRRALKFRPVFCHPAVAIRRGFLHQIRGYLGGFCSEDTELWLRAVHAGARMANLPATLLRYRVHSQQSTATGTGYAEVAGHWLRLLLASPSMYALYGFCVALGKAVCRRFLPGVRSGRYGLGNGRRGE